MKPAQQSLAQKFSKLASRVVQSIRPAFQALASKVASAKPAFQRTAQAITLAVTPQPQLQVATVSAQQAKPPRQRM